MLTKEIKVYLGAAKGIVPPVRLSQYDTDWQFVFSVYNGDEIWSFPESSTVVMEGRKRDGTVFTYPGIYSGSNVLVDCGAQVTSISGDVECELRFSDAGRIVGTANFTLKVEAAPVAGHVASGDDFSGIDQLVNRALEEASRIDSTATEIEKMKSLYGSPLVAPTLASMTDTERVYVYTGSQQGMVAGNWYYYNGTSWVSGGVYNSVAVDTDKTLSVSDKAADAQKTGDLRTALSDMEDFYGANFSRLFMVDLFPTSGYTIGKYLNYNTGVESTSASYFYTDYIPVIPGETYIANFSNNIHTCFYDASKTYVSGILMESLTPFVIPSGCYYMRVSPLYANIRYYRIYQSSEFPTNIFESNQSVLLETLYASNIASAGRIINNSVYASLAEFPSNTVATVAYAFPDIPAGAGHSDVLVFTTAGSYPVQLYLDRNVLYRRIYINGWQDWVVVMSGGSANTVVNVSPSTLLATLKAYNGTGATIILDNSTYNLYDIYKAFYGNDFWTNYNGYGGVTDKFYRGLWVDGVTLKGSGSTVITYDGERTAPIMRDFSLIAPYGDVLIKDMILDIGERNLRYAIHDDYTSEGSNAAHIRYENLIMRGTGVSNGLIGGGCGRGCTYEVINCLFEDNNGTYDMFYHNYVNGTPPSHITVSNCYGLKKCTFRPYGSATDITECIVNNSSFAAITKEPVDESSEDNMRLVTWLCEETDSE